LQRLTVGQVERMLRDMAAAGASSDNIRRARALLGRAIRRAQRDGLVHRNVAELAEVPRGTKRPSKAMTLDQVRALLAADLTPWWRAYVVTALTCGRGRCSGCGGRTLTCARARSGSGCA
jgi:site-specific recombinase XerD